MIISYLWSTNFYEQPYLKPRTKQKLYSNNMLWLFLWFRSRRGIQIINPDTGKSIFEDSKGASSSETAAAPATTPTTEVRPEILIVADPFDFDPDPRIRFVKYIRIRPKIGEKKHKTIKRGFFLPFVSLIFIRYVQKKKYFFFKLWYSCIFGRLFCDSGLAFVNYIRIYRNERDPNGSGIYKVDEIQIAE